MTVRLPMYNKVIGLVAPLQKFISKTIKAFVNVSKSRQFFPTVQRTFPAQENAVNSASTLSTLERKSSASADANRMPCELSQMLWSETDKSSAQQDYLKQYMLDFQSRLMSSVDITQFPRSINSLLTEKKQPTVQVSKNPKFEDFQYWLSTLQNNIPIQIDNHDQCRKSCQSIQMLTGELLRIPSFQHNYKVELACFLERMIWSLHGRLCADVIESANQCLAVLGHVNRIKSPGLRILSIDGGGLRGLSAITILKTIENLCHKPIKQCFDLVCGTSTGAILAALLVAFDYDLNKVDDIYRRFGQVLFNRNVAVGVGTLLTNQAFYDTATWEKVLRQECGDLRLLDSARSRQNPRIAIVACTTHKGRYCPYVFRNYGLTTPSSTQLQGTCDELVWKAIRASTSVPVFYESFAIEDKRFSDGGLVANNPTWIAINEARCLWPNEGIFCVASIGNGRFLPNQESNQSSSLRESLGRVIELATGTETTHLMTQNLLPSSTYFRFNAPMSEEFTLNETRTEKWKIIEHDTFTYVERNRSKFVKMCHRLLMQKRLDHKIVDSMKTVFETFV